MPIKRYGVLKGTALEAKLAGGGGKKPHYQVHLLADGAHHRVAVNVVSDQSPSELLFLLAPDFRHPVLADLPALAPGFTPIPSGPGGMALDFVRGSLFQPEDMTILPHDAPGPDNDLAEIFALYLRRATERMANLYAFGSRWGPETGKRDGYFGFEPGSGVHDIHLNQGSPPPHQHDNGIWQDGALLIHFPAEDQWLAFFLAFQSQLGQTDERGDPLPGSPKFGRRVVPTAPRGLGGPVDLEEVPATAGVRIVAVLANPAAADGRGRTLTVLNSRSGPVDLSGWSIADGDGAAADISGTVVAPGDTVRLSLDGLEIPLSARGSTINLLDREGRRVHGVAYTSDQVSEPGWSIAF